jgi:hypothetical protein
MAEEYISEIVSKEAFEQLKELSAQLIVNKKEMEDLIATAAKFSGEIKGATSGKEVVEKLQQQAVVIEKLNNTTSTRLNIEREIKAEGAKMAQVVAQEAAGWEKVNKVMRDNFATQAELAKTMVDQQLKLGKVKEAIKKLNSEIKENGVATDAQKQKLAEYNVKQADLKVSLSESAIQLKTMSKEQQSVEASYDQLNARLGLLNNSYRQLSEEERNNADIGGVMLNSINQLDEELKGLDKTMGNSHRNVGNYEVAGKSLKTQLLEMKYEIANLKIEYDGLGEKIQEQSNYVNKVASEKGKESAEYVKAAADLKNLQAKYSETEKAMNTMVTTGGKLQDAVRDASIALKSAGQDAGSLVAVTQGLTVMTDAYAVLQGGMAAFGVESKALMEVWAKIQLMQNGINAIQKIALALQKETVLMIKLRLVKEKLMLAFHKEKKVAIIGETVAEAANTAAQKANTAAQAANVTATKAAAASTVALAAGEGVATKASWTLVGAAKAAGMAIKSIPVIGWILAAVAALGTLIALIVKASQTEKENEKIEKEKIARLRKINDLRMEAMKSVQQEVVELQLSVDLLKKSKKGTDEYSYAIQQVSEKLGVSVEWIEENIKSVENLAIAWQKVKLAEATTDIFNKEYAENIVKIKQAEQLFSQLKDASLATTKELLESKKEDLNLTDEQIAKIKAYVHARQGLYVLGGGSFAPDKKAMQSRYVVYNHLLSKLFDEIKLKYQADADAAVKASTEATQEMIANLGLVTEAQKQSSDNQEETQFSADEKLTKEIDDRKKLAELIMKLADLQKKSEKENYDDSISLLTQKYENEKLIYEKNNDVLIALEKVYLLEKAKLDEDFEKKQMERLRQNNDALVDIFTELNTKRIEGLKESGADITNELLSIEQHRYDREFVKNEKQRTDELNKLTDFYGEKNKTSDLYKQEEKEINDKWNAIAKVNLINHTNQEKIIRKQSFEEYIQEIQQNAKRAENALIVKNGRTLTDEERFKLEINSYDELINKMSEYIGKAEEMGMAEQELADKIAEIQAAKVANLENSTEKSIELIRAEKNSQLSLAATIVDSTLLIANAFAANIEDEKQRVRVEQALAMAQVLMNQGIAISEGVALAMKSATIYEGIAKMIAATAAIVAQIITAKNAISQADAHINNAEAYAEGTNYHRGGDAVVGEGGSPELVITGGRSFVATAPTFIPNLPVGSKVIPLTNNTSNNIDLTEILEKMDKLNNRSRVNINVGENVYSYIVKGASRTRILNSQFSH